MEEGKKTARDEPSTPLNRQVVASTSHVPPNMNLQGLVSPTHPINENLDYNGCRIDERTNLDFKFNLVYLFGVEGSKNIRLSWQRVPPPNIAFVPLVIDIVTLKGHGTKQTLRGWTASPILGTVDYVDDDFYNRPTGVRALIHLIGVIDHMAKSSNVPVKPTTTPVTAKKIKTEAMEDIVDMAEVDKIMSEKTQEDKAKAKKTANAMKSSGGFIARLGEAKRQRSEQSASKDAE